MCLITEPQHMLNKNRTKEKNRQIHIVGDFNNSVPVIDRTISPNTSKIIEDLNSTMYKPPGSLSSTFTQCILFKATCAFTRRDHSWERKQSLIKFKRLLFPQ